MVCTRRIILLIAVLSLISSFQKSVADSDLKAREIMQRVDDREDGDNKVSKMTMILVDKHNKERIRKIYLMDKDKGEDKLRMMFFVHPADVKNTGFLTYDYDSGDRDDDQWLYLPALRKSKRIATSNKSGSFMGSDFTYADMTTRQLDAYDYTIKKEMKVREKDVWVIESMPRDEKTIKETGYSKSLLFVRKDNYVVVRAIHWVSKGKKTKYYDVVDLNLINDIWTATEIHMTTKYRGRVLHKTVLKFHDIKYNQNLDNDLFTVRRLEIGL